MQRGRRSSSETRLTTPGSLASPSRQTPSSSTLACEYKCVLEWTLQWKKLILLTIYWHYDFISSDLKIALLVLIFSLAQVARLRASLLPGRAACPGGWRVLQPRRLGSGIALRGIGTSAQSRKWRCWKYVQASLFSADGLQSAILNSFFSILGWTAGGKHKWAKGMENTAAVINSFKVLRVWNGWWLTPWSSLFLLRWSFSKSPTSAGNPGP